MNKPHIAISIGDPNGIGLQIILESHEHICKLCNPVYCIDATILNQASKLLNIKIPKNINLFGNYSSCNIQPGKISKKAGQVSYESFLQAIELTKKGNTQGVVTLPIHKNAWKKAGISYVGHTDMLRDIFKQDAIMMLGCEKMYVALYTEHIPLDQVASKIKTKKLEIFFESFFRSIHNYKDPIAVLGLNPHNGDNGVLGNDDIKIQKAIDKTNKKLKSNFELVVPDVAFTPHVRSKYKYYVAMYHDQGLGPLKALYFDESINVSLNLPIIRTSVDHGTAFDIAYTHKVVSNLSYLNAVNAILTLQQ
ncbi:MAG: 4-hydroxythreonine-4-phosphate dehydrogenase [Campylobacterales bacterium]|nr:4-hydroxythreonine-4-phosphate dehydrogenase [Campylobacterales bacterium]